MLFKFYFPYSGDESLFKYQVSIFSSSNYQEMELSNTEIIITIDKTLREMKWKIQKK